MSAVFLIGGCRDPRGVVASHDPFLEGGWLRPVVCVMHEDEGLDPARSCRRQRVCQWRWQCTGAETSRDDTPNSRCANVLSVLTAQSVQATHLLISGRLVPRNVQVKRRRGWRDINHDANTRQLGVGNAACEADAATPSAWS